jgi:hypothetical protein
MAHHSLNILRPPPISHLTTFLVHVFIITIFIQSAGGNRPDDRTATCQRNGNVLKPAQNGNDEVEHFSKNQTSCRWEVFFCFRNRDPPNKDPPSRLITANNNPNELKL